MVASTGVHGGIEGCMVVSRGTGWCSGHPTVLPTFLDHKVARFGIGGFDGSSALNAVGGRVASYNSRMAD